MASVMEAFNASAATALPEAVHATISSANTGLLSKALDNFTPISWFSVFLTLFAAAVVYDQRMHHPTYLAKSRLTIAIRSLLLV